MGSTEHPQKGFGFLLKDVMRLLGRNFERQAVPLGLTQSQWRALIALARNEGINQVTLADQLDIQPITMTQTIDRLQAAGLVERRPDPTDRRAVLLFLTPAARPVLERIEVLICATLEEALAGMSEAKRRRLIELLTTVKQNLLQAEMATADRGNDGRRSAHR